MFSDMQIKRRMAAGLPIDAVLQRQDIEKMPTVTLIEFLDCGDLMLSEFRIIIHRLFKRAYAEANNE